MLVWGVSVEQNFCDKSLRNHIKNYLFVFIQTSVRRISICGDNKILDFVAVCSDEKEANYMDLKNSYNEYSQEEQINQGL